MNPVGAYGMAVMRATFTAMLANAGIGLGDKRILDLGCGTGGWVRFMAELKDDASDIVGLDLSAERIAFSRKMSPESTHYIQGDIKKVSEYFKPQSFDLITAFVSLMYLRDLIEVKQLMQSIASLLSQGGYFFVSEVNERHDPDKAHSGFPGNELHTAITSTGFALVERRAVFKRFFGWSRLDSYYRARYWNMFAMPFLERVIPGATGYTFMLFQKQSG